MTALTAVSGSIQRPAFHQGQGLRGRENRNAVAGAKHQKIGIATGQKCRTPGQRELHEFFVAGVAAVAGLGKWRQLGWLHPVGCSGEVVQQLLPQVDADVAIKLRPLRRVSNSAKLACENSRHPRCGKLRNRRAGTEPCNSAALIKTLVSSTARSTLIGQQGVQHLGGHASGGGLFPGTRQGVLQAVGIKRPHGLVVLSRHHHPHHAVAPGNLNRAALRAVNEFANPRLASLAVKVSMVEAGWSFRLLWLKRSFRSKPRFLGLGLWPTFEAKGSGRTHMVMRQQPKGIGAD